MLKCNYMDHFSNNIKITFVIVTDVLLDPDTPTILNGGVMSLTGPCFTKSYQNITCLFTDKNGDVTMYSIRRLKRHTIIKGIIVNDQAVCPMPLFRRLGEHRLTIIVDDVTYVGEFVVGKYFVYQLMQAEMIKLCLDDLA